MSCIHDHPTHQDVIHVQQLSLCCFAASQSEDSSFEDLTEESRKLAWANMGNLKLLSSHKIHKEYVRSRAAGCSNDKVQT